VQWQRFNPSGCTARSRSGMRNMQQQAEWLGQCGVPPYQAKGLPTRVCGAAVTPPSSPPSSSTPPSPNPGDVAVPGPSPNPSSVVPVGRTALQVGESVSWGMGRVGAYDSSMNSVVDASAAIAASKAFVVTIDTGCDRSHPDLKCEALVDLVDSSSSANVWERWQRSWHTCCR
jgi:hypothetical protein